MKRLAAAIALCAALLPAAVYAQVGVEVDFTDNGQGVLVAEGTLSGIDPALYHQVSVTGVALVDVVCVRPNGRTEPGAQDMSLQASGYDALAPGDSTFLVVVGPLDLPSPEQAGCHPSVKEVRLGSVDFRGAAVTVSQGATFLFHQGYAV
jgi:hypothetical protein